MRRRFCERKNMNEKIYVGETLRDISKTQYNVNENGSAALSGNYVAAFDDEVLAISQKLIENNLTAYMELAK